MRASHFAFVMNVPTLLCLGLVLALETFHISEVTLSLVACQRLWRFDIERGQRCRMHLTKAATAHLSTGMRTGEVLA